MTIGRKRGDSAQRPLPGFLVGVLIVMAGTMLISPSSLAQTTTYASDCTTPKTTFNLGETVCARATALSGLRFQWVNPDGFAVAMSSITSNSQSDSLVLPSTDQSSIGGLFTANNLGRWRLNAVTSRNSVGSSAFFTVKDPGNPRVDLSIVKSFIGSDNPAAGDPVQFFVTIVNNGPNDALNARFVDNTFSNAVFNSLSQSSGPPFSCSGANCHIASMPNGAVATFIINFTAGPAGGVLENTVTISSDTPELNPSDNSSSSAPIKVATLGNPPTCNLVLAAPPAVTLFTGSGANSCSVPVSDLETTLGTASATDTCPLAGSITVSGVPSGSVFPVGVTTLTYSTSDTEGNTAAAIQQITVADNTLPTINCLGPITVEPTCPAGAVAIWAAPTGSDNCPGASTAQSAGPAPGSVFPIGTTSVTYTVTDAASNRATCTFSVTVLSVADAIQNLEASVSGSSLNGPQKQGLLPKLDAALAAINRGTTKAACGSLSAFINEVQDLILSGGISAAQGHAWTQSVSHIANTVGCTSSSCS